MHPFSSTLGILTHLTVGLVLSLSNAWHQARPSVHTAPPVQPSVAIHKTATTTPKKIVATVRTAKPAPISFTAPKKQPKPIPVVKPEVLIPTPLPLTTPAQQAAPATLPTPVPTPPPPAVAYNSPEVVNTQIRESLVNILCTTQTGGSMQSISGSGVLISSKGIVLTNAHVGQFFLLKDYAGPHSINCVIRTGSPAMAQYSATLLYLPPAWVTTNAKEIKSAAAVGTGEDDYAFLLITGRLDGTSLPAKFPNALLALDVPEVGDPVVLASYPAQFLGASSIQMNLYTSSAVSTVQKLYTFAAENGPIDVVSLGSSIVAQSGSSGGAAARLTDGALYGIITTATEGTTTDTRELRAITLAHIDRSLTKYGKGGLVPFLTSGNTTEKADDFNTNVAPGLTKQLTDALR